MGGVGWVSWFGLGWVGGWGGVGWVGGWGGVGWVMGSQRWVISSNRTVWSYYESKKC